MTELVDSHCHLQRFHQAGQLPDVLARCKQSGVTQLVSVGTSLEDWSVYRQLSQQHPGEVFYSAGLHPCHVEADWEQHVEQLAGFWKQPSQPKPVALGEIGLDAFHLPKDPQLRQQVMARQEAAFTTQLEIARPLACPIIIHSRSAVARCIQILDHRGCDWTRVVFHCYTDTAAALEPILQRGGRASFTGVITFKSAHSVRGALLKHGLNRLMLETDAPYLAPEPLRGQTCEPAMIAHTAAKAADILDVPLDSLSAATTANARAFFGI
jgi:TatD DNase family protein